VSLSARRDVVTARLAAAAIIHTETCIHTHADFSSSMTKATTELVKQVATLTAETARIAAVSQINLRPVGRGVRWVRTHPQISKM